MVGIGDIIGGFKIEKELGKGGMGIVYKAHELSLNRKVALKVLSKRLSSDEGFIKRFKREAEMVAALNHPNIVNILSYGEEHGHYYFAMEYLRGKDLGQLMNETPLIPLEEALSITAQVASALDEAGARGMVHRDLKPQNIMIDEMGRAKVTDFGVAYWQDANTKLTRTGLFMGTPEYASPEQAMGKSIDVKSDIYSLGAVLYKMLSGKPPITGESPLAVLMKINTEPVTPLEQVNPSVPKPVCELVKKMMAKEPADRLQSPKAVLGAIEACIDRLEVDAPMAKSKIAELKTVPPSIPKRTSHAKLIGGILGVALAILLSVWIVDAVFLKEKSPSETKVVEQPTASGEEAAKTVNQTLESVEKTAETVKQPNESSEAPTQSAKQSIEPAEKPAGLETAHKTVEEALPQQLTEKTLNNNIALKSPSASTEPKKATKLPRIPTVLTMVSGDDALIPIVRTYLESIIAESGLKQASISEIPVLRSKTQFGDYPITWYSVKHLIPKGKADILLLAQVQKTGSMPLKYYGRRQELIIASFSVQAIDMATGTSATRSVTGTVKFTPLNMDENFKEAVTSTATGMGAGIKQYWRNKISKR